MGEIVARHDKLAKHAISDAEDVICNMERKKKEKTVKAGGGARGWVKSSLPVPPAAAAAAAAEGSCLRRAFQRVGTRVSQPISRYALLKVARFSNYSPVMNELAALTRC